MEQLKFELLRSFGFDPQQLYPVELVLFLFLLLLLLFWASRIFALLDQVDAIVRVGPLTDCFSSSAWLINFLAIGRNFSTGLFGFHSFAKIFWRSWKASAEHSYTDGPCYGCAGLTMGRRKNTSLFPFRVFLCSGARIAPHHSGRSPFLRASARLFFCSGVVLNRKGASNWELH